MALHIYIHDGADATPEQIAKVRALYERPGTPGEKAAAEAALRRMGVDPSEQRSQSSYTYTAPPRRSGPKRYSVRVDYDVDGKQTFAVVDVTATDELDAEAKARAIIKKEKGAKNIRSGRARREN